ncbi:MAG TPA: AI-2E family transporter, partial [Pseudomonadaceae bacterium]|nr:AI-2E family transporter [Pseudomonadaceae bacterium]
MLRDFFAHIFITFILIFVASPLTRLGQRWMKLPYRVSLALVYLCFVLMLAGFVRYVTPSVIGEASLFLNNFSELQHKLLERKNDFSERYPGMVRPLHGYMRSVLDESALVGIDEQLVMLRQQIGLSDLERVQYDPDDAELDAEAGTKLRRYYDREAELLTTALVSHASGKVREQLPGMLDYLYTGTATVLLALLFSFLILYDSVRLGGQIKNLEASRLRDFYHEVAQPVIRFAYVVGRAIQAQAMIAVINTLLTFIGLLVMGLPSIALLS